MKVCCITNDVEATSIYGEPYRDDIAQNVANESLPALLALYKKYDVKATFYCLASYIEKYPEIVKMIQDEGHEVACHGWIHNSDKAFDVLSKADQIKHLTKAKTILETFSNEPVVSFRAPALRVNESTTKALEEVGFITDSSVSSQRMDMFMSLGSRHKLAWIKAPRAPYKASYNNLARKGESSITEVPVSAMGLPYISTIMRMSPFLNKITRYFIYWNTCGSNKRLVNFLFHPSEAISINTAKSGKIQHRSSNPIVHWFSDVLRMKLKRRNLGPDCLLLLEKELAFWQKKGYEFKTIKECQL